VLADRTEMIRKDTEKHHVNFHCLSILPNLCIFFYWFFTQYVNLLVVEKFTLKEILDKVIF
jgi:hypothetical protein